jgi:hypothetical protein
MSIAAVDQRLSALLEELESGLRRSRMMETTKEYDVAEAEPPPVSAHLPYSEPETTERGGLSAEARAAAIILLCLLAGAVWSFFSTPGTPPSSETAARADANMAAGEAGAGAVTTQPALRLDAAPVGDSARANLNASAPAADDPGGLSIDEFNVQVQRLLAKKRGEPHPRANDSDPWLDGPLASNEEPPAAMEALLPLPPPQAAPAAESPAPEPQPVASAPAAAPLEAAGPVEAIEKLGEQPTPVVKAKARPAKPKRAKVASKPVAAPPTPAAAPAPSGPASFIQGATAAITGVVRDWGKMATGVRR